MPRIYVIGGPNGAGKTTASMALFPHRLQCPEYVNADAIAVGISPFRPESVASRSFAPFLRDCIAREYKVYLLFVWLKSPDLAIERVAHRVAAGGHHIPDDVVRRRYVRGIQNFVSLYIPLAKEWECYDNSHDELLPVASKAQDGRITIEDQEKWKILLSQ